MCSPESAILASIVTIFVRLEAILIYIPISKLIVRKLTWNWLLKLIFSEIIFKIASKLTSIVTILAIFTLAGEHIFQVLAQYLDVLSQYLQVLSQNLRVLSRWIHPNTLYAENRPQQLSCFIISKSHWEATFYQMLSPKIRFMYIHMVYNVPSLPPHIPSTLFLT